MHYISNLQLQLAIYLYMHFFKLMFIIIGTVSRGARHNVLAPQRLAPSTQYLSSKHPAPAVPAPSSHHAGMPSAGGWGLDSRLQALEEDRL